MSESAPNQLPQLYIYDHCPFCCRARVTLGLKKVKYDVLFLASHDEATPIGLVGSKQAPIFVPVGEKPFPESWDIVSYVDKHYGDGPILKEASGRQDLAKWIDTVMPLLVDLFLPRFYAAPLPEFTLRESRDYFKNKKEKSIGPFSDALAKSPELVEKVNKLLIELEPMLHSSHSVNEQLGYDDLDLFGRLRGLTLVKGIEWPAKIRAFIEYFSEAGDVPLYDNVPKLYIYDFCPFSCRARVALGLKKVKYDVVFMAYDDEVTPVSLVGSKAAPIFVPVGGKPFTESWDVVSYVDKHYGDGPIIKEASGREDLAKWIETAMPMLNALYTPRFYSAPLPELTLCASRKFFKDKREKGMGPFSEALANSHALVEKANKLLVELESMLHSNHSANEELSYDDLDLFGRLRALTLVKSIEWPTKVREFMDYFSEAGDVPMFDAVVKI
ncbi:hypothetical protein BBJ29_005568 [Phytophthora kernoviae]|uniref:GST N-terminal domain-containing protein n=1 Tax=Phytophthora kernoviae TaxID=325452 RepID=A0A3F2RGZ0_9STRA|nr:hypothetical protein BBJ29_005568 [Phytophthora kernoviae]RLN56708.1 hypothetical protein BBP00_00007869 [Phytophthora kernoviae]